MSIQIMIVDDDKAVRFFHNLTVTESTASEPISFCDGKEALDYLDQHFNEKDYYLVLLDINMPVMNGWELLNAIKTKSYSDHVFFAMVTSSVDRADREKARSFTQVIDFVEKPISVEEYKRIVDTPRIAGFFNEPGEAV
jgi:CheY-like chemotaxis protein